MGPREAAHGYEMDLDLARASERFSYFTGRFYELGMQLLLIDLVAPATGSSTSARTSERSRCSARVWWALWASSMPSSRTRGVPTDSPPRSPGITSAISDCTGRTRCGRRAWSSSGFRGRRWPRRSRGCRRFPGRDHGPARTDVGDGGDRQWVRIRPVSPTSAAAAQSQDSPTGPARSERKPTGGGSEESRAHGGRPACGVGRSARQRGRGRETRPTGSFANDGEHRWIRHDPASPRPGVRPAG